MAGPQSSKLVMEEVDVASRMDLGILGRYIAKTIWFNTMANKRDDPTTYTPEPDAD